MFQLVGKCLAKSAELTLYSLLGVGAAIVTTWLPLDYTIGKRGWGVNVTKREPMVFLTIDETLYNEFVMDAPLVSSRIYFTLAFMFYLNLPLNKMVVVVLFNLAFYVTLVSLGLLNTLITQALPIVIGLLSIRVCVPPGSNVGTMALHQAVAAMASCMFALVLCWIPQNSDKNRILLACFVFPFFRELLYGLVRFSSRRMALKPHPSGELIPVKRDYIWFFFLWCQLGVSMFTRIFFAGFVEDTTFYIALFIQSFVEVASRLSIGYRDAMFFSCGRWFEQRAQLNRVATISEVTEAAKRKQSVVVAPHVLTSKLAKSNRLSRQLPEGESKKELIAETDEDVMTSHKYFTSVIILGEMASEYCAIILVPVVIYFFRETPLKMPMEAYASWSEPFQFGDAMMGAILQSTAIQFACEVFVDTICCYTEVRRGYPLFLAWRMTHKIKFALIFCLAASVASTGMYMYIWVNAWGDWRICEQEKIDICNCVDGLPTYSLFSKYCRHIYGSDGLPPHHNSSLFF